VKTFAIKNMISGDTLELDSWQVINAILESADIDRGTGVVEGLRIKIDALSELVACVLDARPELIAPMLATTAIYEIGNTV
jgi:hypothetical protein